MEYSKNWKAFLPKEARNVESERGGEIIIFGYLGISYEEVILHYIFSSDIVDNLRRNAAAFQAKATRQAPNGHHPSAR
jgi:hypothetical protein